jgi:hypothetical protein
MDRHEFEHIIGAAANVLGEDAFIVVGSQAILGPYPEAPAALLRSIEVDLKCVADRSRDWDFARQALRAKLVNPGTLLARTDGLPIDRAHGERIRRRLSLIIGDLPSDE